MKKIIALYLLLTTISLFPINSDELTPLTTGPAPAIAVAAIAVATTPSWPAAFLLITGLITFRAGCDYIFDHYILPQPRINPFAIPNTNVEIGSMSLEAIRPSKRNTEWAKNKKISQKNVMKNNLNE